MAQQIKLMGATYSDVPSVRLPDSSGTLHSFDDTSDADATAEDISAGKTAYVNGVKITGIASGGGSSSWTKVAETTYTASTTSTTASTLATWATGHNEIWTSDKLVYVRVRDTAGKRAGYFYGSDTFYYNTNLVNGTSATYITTFMCSIIRYSTDGNFAVTLVTSGTYGVFPDRLYPDGRIRIRSRYNSTYSLTIDGTYKVEVYLLDTVDGVPIFE